MSVSVLVSNIVRGSLHDGPGIRTVVYFKGCGLRCKWCHNPEALSFEKLLLYTATKCIHCGRCFEVCPDCRRIQDGEMLLLRENCIGCGKCAEECPSSALELCGEEKTVSELFEIIKKDSHYYKASGGGVTFSGGECLLHPRFVAEIAKMCKENQINTAVETALFVPWENIELILPHIDLFFADFKIANPEKHKKYTGSDNGLILENLFKLSQKHNNIVVRIPIIPGVNDSEKDINEFADVINTLPAGVKAVELLRYNNLAYSKYMAAGNEYTEFSETSQTDTKMEKLCLLLSQNCNRSCYFV